MTEHTLEQRLQWESMILDFAGESASNGVSLSDAECVAGILNYAYQSGVMVYDESGRAWQGSWYDECLQSAESKRARLVQFQDTGPHAQFTYAFAEGLRLHREES